MDAYQQIHFPCPHCGRSLVVERRDVASRLVVTCSDCNTDLALVARGHDEAVEGETAPPPGARRVALRL